jgi:nucleotide-binding universal stress UspA family protein
MSTTMHATPEAIAAIQAIIPPDGPIIVATDTTPESDAAFPLAAALAARSNSEILAVSVIEPMNVPIYGVDGMVVAMDSFGETEASREHATRAQLLRMVSGTAQWPVMVRMGEAAREVSTVAGSMHARLVVIGRGRHHGLDRLLDGESALRLLQVGDAPVLAVQEGLTSPPRRVVIATDFSPFSLYAAQVAMSVVAADATVWLLHVGPAFDESVAKLKARADLYRAQAATAFAQLRSKLGQDRIHFEDVILTGNVSDQLLRYSIDQKADLVVAATHGYGFIRRMVLGSVAAALVRNAPSSVLVVPGSARTVAESRANLTPNTQTRTLSFAQLDTELAHFTLRNAARLCLIEVDQQDFGAQVLGQELPLAGATFDRHGNAVSLMFGTSEIKGRHLTHTISGVTQVDLTTNGGGADQVLRIVHPEGYTLVMLSRVVRHLP